MDQPSGATKPQYTLAELLTQCDPDSLAPMIEDTEWLDGAPIGTEAI